MKEKNEVRAGFSESQKYFWEFLRRDPEYKKAYSEVIKLTKKKKRSKDEEKKLMEFSERFCIPFGDAYDPDVGYDELRMAKYWRAMVPMPTLFLNNRAVKFPQVSGGADSMFSKLSIEIDFREVNSIDALKKSICEFIDGMNKLHKKRAVLKKRDYDLYLEIGDLRRDNPEMTFEQIGEIVFNDTDLESSKVKTFQHHKQYEEMTSGGWKKLTFP